MGDIPVHTDVLTRDLEPSTLEALRRALAQGLTPFDLDFVDDSVVILRLTRLRAAEAHPTVGVEFSSEDNEIVRKVYDAESQLKYTMEPSDAHLT
jgi:hypothetical protein